MGRRVKMKLGPPVQGWRAGVRRGGVYYDGDADSIQEALILVGTSKVAEQRALGLEKMLLVNLDHPNLLRLRSLAVAPGKKRPVFAYNFVRGVGLQTVLDAVAAADGFLPPGVAASVVAQAAAAAHSVCTVGAEMGGHGIWHRGPHPDDLLVDATGTVRLVGFQVWREGARPQGERQYSSPARELGPTGLAYGIGALLLTVLGGNPPPATSEEGHDSRVHDASAKVRVVRGPWVEPLLELVRACMSWRPAERPPLGVLAMRLEELRLRAPAPGPVLWAAQAVPVLLDGQGLPRDLVVEAWQEPANEGAVLPAEESASSEEADHGERPTELLGARAVGRMVQPLASAGPSEPDIAETSGAFSDHGNALSSAGTRDALAVSEAPLEGPAVGGDTQPETLSSRNALGRIPNWRRMPLATRAWLALTAGLTIAVIVSVLVQLGSAT